MYNLEDHKEEFLAFVKQQSPDREVDHHSWEACAVGDFSLTLLGHRNIEVQDYDYYVSYDEDTDEHDIYDEDTEQVPKFARFMSVLNIMGTQEGPLNTYGELQEILKEIEEKLEDDWDYYDGTYVFLSEFIAK